MLTGLKLNFSGSNVTSTTMALFLHTVVLKGSNSVDVTAKTTNSGFGAAVAFDQVASSSATWTFATSSANTASSTLVISPGSPVTLQLWGTTNAIPGITNRSESLSASLQNTTDVAYLDATDGTGSTLNLPVNAVPLTVTSFSYGTGQ